MRRIAALVLVLGMFMVFAGEATAFVWHLGYGQAKNATKNFAKEVCREDPECKSWGVGPCLRRSESRFDCTMGVFYRDFFEPEDEAECDIVLHWGVDRAGYVALKRHGPPHCFQI
jgi:hypothetical protein